ncbi:hypothetical protein CLV38_12436 [Alkalibacterium olivapovliticus]|uniref:Uncharacterized protein n=1 Tax=Alkalibacterium olivapovliticus TaxID=99907 RepID=A0A2T0W2B2_9LACT|nr:hypothetical protein CLV38_12436 [Alkalibacterium olivapovliticus]
MFLPGNKLPGHMLILLTAVIPGLLFSLKYETINWLPLVMLTLYTSLLLYIRHTIQQSKTIQSITGIVAIIIPIVFFALNYSVTTLLLLSIIPLLFCSKPLFLNYNLMKLYSLLEIVIIIVCLNSFSFYLQTYFITLEVLLFLSSIVVGIIVFRFLLIKTTHGSSEVQKKESH